MSVANPRTSYPGLRWLAMGVKAGWMRKQFFVQCSCTAQEKPFPLRVVPESLEKAAAKSLEALCKTLGPLSEDGASQNDLMEVPSGGLGFL